MPPGSSGAKEETFTNIAIKTLNDFDAAHPAGSDISEFYTINPTFEGNNRPLGQFLTEQTGVTVQFESYELFLQQSPENSGTFQTEITVTLSNGEVYTAQSIPFFLTD